MPVGGGAEEAPGGRVLLAAIARGLCGLSFLREGGGVAAVRELRPRWEGATLEHAPAAIRGYAQALRARLRGEKGQPLSLVLKGTPLQLKVWEALLRIPQGGVVGYGDVAKLAGTPKAFRAVGVAGAQKTHPH